MKTTLKTVFSFISAGFILLAFNYPSGAQSSPEPQTLSPQILKLLCERFPLNSRCTSESSPNPVSPSTPSGGGSLAPTTPQTEPPVPAPTNAAPTGSGEVTVPIPPSEGVPTTPAPQGAPNPGQTEKPLGPSSAIPLSSQPTKIAETPVAPAPSEGLPLPATGGGTSAAAVGTILDVANTSDQLKTLSAALKAAGLDIIIAGKGPFTVFAPTDTAFAALPPGTVDELLKPENKEKLAKLLTYHVVSGKVESTALKSGEVPTVMGAPVMVKVEGQQVMVNDAKVLQADIPASNGIIHLIDKVMLPGG